MTPTEVSIGELVVHGLPVGDPGRFGDAVVGALERLLVDRGLPEMPGPEAVPVTLRVEPDASSARLAEHVADAVWRSLGGEADR